MPQDFTGKMSVPQGFHRQDACATGISQARCLCHRDFTGRMPVLQDFKGRMPVLQDFKGFHRQDACATRISQASCLCHKDFTGKMPVLQDFTGRMPVLQIFTISYKLAAQTAAPINPTLSFKTTRTGIISNSESMRPLCVKARIKPPSTISGKILAAMPPAMYKPP